ncbi:uncharacterized protein LOC131685748 [Topomyia yanbarensis]|uniref:uncharacterized protein LOC131685748 n=1 Tax=Topomyia yanbarensis TaxID=2498891 RepID=UPI00273B5760|nr:uncharacterized protein LOC131685748 [Topomyia yanbarensis]
MLTSNHVILKSVTNITLDTTCNVPKRNLTGTYLLEFHNCTLYVNGTIFANSEITIQESPTIIPLNGLIIEKQKVETPLKLEEVHIANRRQMELISHYKTQTYTSISISSFSIILGSICLIYLIRKKQVNVKISQNLTDHQNNTAQQEQTNQDEQANQDDSDLYDGVVMNSLAEAQVRTLHPAQQQQQLEQSLSRLEQAHVA